MTRTTPRLPWLAVLFEVAIVLLYALFLVLPRLSAGRSAADSTTLAWLALPFGLSRHGLTLEYATAIVTISALTSTVLGALLSIVGRRRSSSGLRATGSWLFGCSVAILMPVWTAAGFLGALLLVIALRSRFVALAPSSLLAAVLAELWPAGYALGFAALAWRYNPQLLLQCLLVAFGASLVGRAFVPARPAI